MIRLMRVKARQNLTNLGGELQAYREVRKFLVLAHTDVPPWQQRAGHLASVVIGVTIVHAHNEKEGA